MVRERGGMRYIAGIPLAAAGLALDLVSPGPPGVSLSGAVAEDDVVTLEQLPAADASPNERDIGRGHR